MVEKNIYIIFPSDMLGSKGFSVVGGTVSFMKLVTAWAILIVYLIGLVGMINIDEVRVEIVAERVGI